MAGVMKSLIVVCIIIGAADAVVSIGLRGAAAAAGAAVPGFGLGGKAADKGGGIPSPTGAGAGGDGDAPEEWEVAFPDTPYEGKAKEEFLAFKKQSRLEEEEFYKGEPLDPKVQALKAEYAAEVEELMNKHDPEELEDLIQKPSPEEEDPFLKIAHEYATNPNVPTPEGLKPGPNGPATVGMVFEKAKKAKKLGALRPDRLLRKFLGQLREVSGNAQHWVLDKAGLVVEKGLPAMIVLCHFPFMAKWVRSEELDVDEDGAPGESAGPTAGAQIAG